MSSSWTTSDMPDLTGRVIIVTGANSGVGFEAAKEFARKGAAIIMACRNAESGNAALELIRTEVAKAQGEVTQLDLASLESVRAFADNVFARHRQIDVLVNNAGIMMAPYGKTPDGFENQFGTNHLGHFALTGLLLEPLLNTPGSRVVTVSSAAHRFGRMDFEDLMYEQSGYAPTRAYGRSKLANLLFTYELQRRLETAGVSTIAVAAHPGTSSTNLTRHIEKRRLFRIVNPVSELLSQDSAMGALPTLRAAVDPTVTGGQYFGPDGFMEQRGHPVVVKSKGASHSEADARRLWQVSEELTNVHFSQLES